MAHHLTLCTTCRHTKRHCQPGFEMIRRLRAAVDAAGTAVSEGFEVSGTAQLDGCERPCTVAYIAARDAAYLFGDVDPSEEVTTLRAYAEQEIARAAIPSATASGATRPAHMPAAMLALAASESHLS